MRIDHPLWHTYSNMRKRYGDMTIYRTVKPGETWTDEWTQSSYPHDESSEIELKKRVAGKVCERWLGWYAMGFWNFVEDMGERPSPKHRLRRIDPKGNWEPGNCEWRCRRKKRP